MAPEGAIAQAAMFGPQLRAAAALARGTLPVGGYRAIALCGLGGSAAGGRLAVALFADRLAVPVAVVQDPGLPGWVGPDALVCVTSYSGMTLEALDWYEAAGASGAGRLVICAGGDLAERAGRDGVPAVLVEGGYQPRHALGLLLGSLLVCLHDAGALPDPADVIARGAAAAELVADDHGGEEARRVAAALAGRVAVLYGDGARAAVAVRLKNQLNENAKVLAFAGSLPEAAHNEALGWHHVGRLALLHTAVFLRDPGERRDMVTLADALAGFVVEDGGQVLSLEGRGADEAARLFGLLALGDFISCHLADAEGVDALDIARLTELKLRLAAARAAP